MQKALTAIQYGLTKKKNRHLQELIYDKARKLYEKKHLLEIWWILAYLNLTKNNKAHLVAKNRAEKRDKQAENLSLLVYIKKNIRQICRKKLIS